MNIYTKKILAREFLVLILCFIIGVLYFLSIYPYNYLKNNKINILTKEVSEKKKISYSLSKSFRQKTAKQYWYSTQFKSKFYIDGYSKKLNDDLWTFFEKLIKSDSLIIKGENTLDERIVSFNIELGFETPEKFQSFIITNIISQEDIEKNQKSLKIDSEIDVLNNKIKGTSKKVFTVAEQIKASYWAFSITMIIFFLFRYIYYGINWSIKTLKQS